MMTNLSKENVEMNAAGDKIATRSLVVLHMIEGLCMQSMPVK